MSELNALEQRVLNQAVAALTAIGAQYCIRVRDLECGELVVPKRPAATRKRRFSYTKHYNIDGLVGGAETGSKIEVQVLPEHAAGAHSAMCYWLGKKFGLSNFATRRKNGVIFGMGTAPVATVQMRAVA